MLERPDFCVEMYKNPSGAFRNEELPEGFKVQNHIFAKEHAGKVVCTITARTFAEANYYAKLLINADKAALTTQQAQSEDEKAARQALLKRNQDQRDEIERLERLIASMKPYLLQGTLPKSTPTHTDAKVLDAARIELEGVTHNDGTGDVVLIDGHISRETYKAIYLALSGAEGVKYEDVARLLDALKLVRGQIATELGLHQLSLGWQSGEGKARKIQSMQQQIALIDEALAPFTANKE